MLTLMHISDLHFGPVYQAEAGRAVLQAAQEIVPDAVLCTGDIVHWDHDEPAWRAARDFFAEFQMPLVSCPGNHDIARLNPWRRLLDPFALYTQYIHPAIDRVERLEGATIVSLGVPRRWSMELGYISGAQIDWSERCFSTSSAQDLRVIMIHHGLGQHGSPMRRNAVRGNKRALRRWTEMGVDVVLSGHNHFPHSQWFGDDRRGLLWAQSGTTTSKRFSLLSDFRKNTLSVLRATGTGLDLEWWHYDPGSQRFSMAAREHHPRNQAFVRGAA